MKHCRVRVRLGARRGESLAGVIVALVVLAAIVALLVGLSKLPEYAPRVIGAWRGSRVCADSLSRGFGAVPASMSPTNSAWTRLSNGHWQTAIVLRPRDLSDQHLMTAVCHFHGGTLQLDSLGLFAGDRLTAFKQTTRSILDPRLLWGGGELHKTVYAGLVRNSIGPATANIRLTFDDEASTDLWDGGGLIEIGPPLSGTGRFQYSLRADTVTLSSGSPDGTIVWKGRLDPDGTRILFGTYEIVTGVFSGQTGQWSANRIEPRS